MKENLKNREAKDQKPQRPQFVPCGRRSSLGGFDPLGYLPGRNPDGSDCINGMRRWWSHMQMDSMGKPVHTEKLELVASECRCLKRWKAGISSAELPVPKDPQSQLLDSKVRAAGGAQ